MLKEQGALANNDGFVRYNGKINLDHRITNDLAVQLSVYHNRSHSDVMVNTPFSVLLLYDPTINLAARDSAGNLLQFPDPEFETENPIWTQASGRDTWEKRERTLGSVSLRYSPLDWLRIVGQYSYDRGNEADQIYVPKGVPQNPFEGNPTDGRLMFLQDGEDAQNGSLLFTASRTFGQFNPRLTLGGTFEKYDRLFFGAEGRNLAVEGIRDLDVAADKSDITSTVQEERANGILADLALDYAGKYIGSFVARRDGSSRYGPDRRWHTYYAGRVAYRMSEESWWPLKNVVTEFKPRIAIGTAGGRPTYGQQYETWSVSIPTGGSPNFSRGTAGNPLLSPEKTLEQEYGVDFTLYRNHDFRITYVRQDTDDLILQGVAPAAEGYFSRWQNLGAQAGTTWEFEYGARLVTTPKFAWNATVVADRSNSWMTRWDAPTFPAGHRQWGLEGTMYDIWGRYILTSRDELATKAFVSAEFHDQFDVNDDGYLVWVGQGNTWRDGIAKNLWGTSGMVDGRSYGWGMPIVQRTESGAIASVRIGSSRPDFNFGVLNNIHWRNFDIHLHVRGQKGGNIYSKIKQYLYQQMRHADVDQSGKAHEAKKPLTYYRNAGLYQFDSYVSAFIEDASFLKVQALNVSYRFGQDQLTRFLGRQAPNSLSLGITARNLFTLTAYDGWDPDVGTPLSRLDAHATYPNMRQWTAVVEITF